MASDDTTDASEASRTELPALVSASKYQEPSAHLRKIGPENWQEAPGRRPSDVLLANASRQVVTSWRAKDYPGASQETVTLLRHWFVERGAFSSSSTGRPFYFAQREAIETVIYLCEVKKFTDFFSLLDFFSANYDLGDWQKIVTSKGDRLLRRSTRLTRQIIEQEVPAANEKRYAVKMATGTGKTLVMAALMVWSYFHKHFRPDSHLAQNFLLLTPNLIVYDRMMRDFEGGKIFEENNLVPLAWQPQWRLTINLAHDDWRSSSLGQLFISNIQKVSNRRKEKSSHNPVHKVIQLSQISGKKKLQEQQEILRELPSLMVFNDEAHHVHDSELLWSKTLRELNEHIMQRNGHGFSAWLDFSATPRDGLGNTFPWVVSDFPLADAVDHNIVKVPVINHQVDVEDPVDGAYRNAADSYAPWIQVALNIHRAQSKHYEKVGSVPILFFMTESTKDARQIAERLEQEPDLNGKIVTIHTSNVTGDDGNITEDELRRLRGVVKRIDEPDSSYRVVVSVLMLREGWDVRNVTTVVGLRPFSSKSRILPEQAIGRGLRRMIHFPENAPQVLEVVGTRAFQDFVKTLEDEGVLVNSASSLQHGDEAIYVCQDKQKVNIELPLTTARIVRSELQVEALDITDVNVPAADILESKQDTVDIERYHGTLDVRLDTQKIDFLRGPPPLLQQSLVRIANEICRKARLPGYFHRVYPIVDRYVVSLFGDFSDELVHRRASLTCSRPEFQERLSDRLAAMIAMLTVQERSLELLSETVSLLQTQPFMWNGPCLASHKSVFNLVACTNGFELAFANFLNACPDVIAFSRLCEEKTRFYIEYLKPRGAFGRYYPDFVVVQSRESERRFFILETKGQEDENVQHKDFYAARWCYEVSALSGQKWQYIKVPYREFERRKLSNFEQVVQRWAVAAAKLE